MWLQWIGKTIMVKKLKRLGLLSLVFTAPNSAKCGHAFLEVLFFAGSIGCIARALFLKSGIS